MNRLATACLALALLATPPARAATADDSGRWDFLASTLFAERPLQDAGDRIHITMPDRALDAALVPLTIDLDFPGQVTTVSVIVDNNPSPLVGNFHLGPAFVAKSLKMRVRIDDFTLVHVVAETADGQLYAAAKYMRVAGGCSAPGSGEAAQVLARMGRMQFRRLRSTEGVPRSAELMISHPNYNGMQMSPTSKDFTPARYLQSVSVSTGGTLIFALESDISMSEDPAIGFGYTPAGDGTVDVVATDSTGARFSQHFQPL